MDDKAYVAGFEQYQCGTSMSNGGIKVEEI